MNPIKFPPVRSSAIALLLFSFCCAGRAQSSITLPGGSTTAYSDLTFMSIDLGAPGSSSSLNLERVGVLSNISSYGTDTIAADVSSIGFLSSSGLGTSITLTGGTSVAGPLFAMGGSASVIAANSTVGALYVGNGFGGADSVVFSGSTIGGNLVASNAGTSIALSAGSSAAVIATMGGGSTISVYDSSVTGGISAGSGFGVQAPDSITVSNAAIQGGIVTNNPGSSITALNGTTITGGVTLKGAGNFTVSLTGSSVEQLSDLNGVSNQFILAGATDSNGVTLNGNGDSLTATAGTQIINGVAVNANSAVVSMANSTVDNLGDAAGTSGNQFSLSATVVTGGVSLNGAGDNLTVTTGSTLGGIVAVSMNGTGEVANFTGSTIAGELAINGSNNQANLSGSAVTGDVQITGAGDTLTAVSGSSITGGGVNVSASGAALSLTNSLADSLTDFSWTSGNQFTLSGSTIANGVLLQGAGDTFTATNNSAIGWGLAVFGNNTAVSLTGSSAYMIQSEPGTSGSTFLLSGSSVNAGVGLWGAGNSFSAINGSSIGDLNVAGSNTTVSLANSRANWLQDSAGLGGNLFSLAGSTVNVVWLSGAGDSLSAANSSISTVSVYNANNAVVSLTHSTIGQVSDSAGSTASQFNLAGSIVMGGAYLYGANDTLAATAGT